MKHPPTTVKKSSGLSPDSTKAAKKDLPEKLSGRPEKPVKKDKTVTVQNIKPSKTAFGREKKVDLTPKTKISKKTAAVSKPEKSKNASRKSATAPKISKPLEKQAEKTASEPNTKPRKKILKPIGSAVFRGKKELYDFKVFPLNEQFEAIQAVYVISKRKTDKYKRGHHFLICIGQTNSIHDEIKKHRKNRCLKKNDANVISLLRESDEQKRLKIAADLKAAHAISCSLEEQRIEH